MIKQFWRGRSSTIKTKVLAIAMVPSAALLAVGVAVSLYLVDDGVRAGRFADDVRNTLGPTSKLVVGLQEERRLTILQLSRQPAGAGELDRRRDVVDAARADMRAAGDTLAEHAPASLNAALDDFTTAAARLPEVREQVDSGAVVAQQAYDFYSELIDDLGTGIQGIARSAIDAEVGFEQMIAFDLFKSAEAMSRAHAMAVLAVSTGLDDKQFHELAHQLGMYHELAETVVPRMTPAEQRKYAELKETASWEELVAGDNSLMARGPESRRVSFDVPGWEAAARTVGDGLVWLYTAHSDHAADLGAASGRRTLLTSLVVGAGILAVAIVAIGVAIRLSRRLIGRLTRLRQETLALAESELPDVVSRLRQGDPVDIDGQVPWLDFGHDEIGQVAHEFNKAQRTAISAAVQEAETRRGVGSVFLNIAHRSQVIVHRQLKVLDKVERSEADPDQLQLLFQLDHLATRSRRNAENLIILGGQQPGRQWRNPVSLREVVRSAVAETEHYTRVVTAAVPDSLMDGSVVADLAHLLAELVDNATAFSPPQARVEVRGNLAGKGVVLEIEDQGLGIDAEQRDELNAMLRRPPDFSVMALSTESRVGMFVVAKLAERHGIKIALRESIYGGTTAVVLVPNLLVMQDTTPRTEPAEPPALPPAEPQAAPELEAVAEAAQEQTWTTVRFDVPVDRPDDPARPPLPQRTRQASLAPQLAEETPAGEPAGQPVDADAEADRARVQFAALQQATARAQAVSGTTTSNGRHG